FVSSVSVYSDRSKTPVEEHALEQLGDMPADRLLDDYSNYGALKALSEEAVAAVFPGAHANVRPGLIVGPHDPTGRFTYWPHRVARGVDVLAPGTPNDPVQIVDVRDLAEWLVRLCGPRTAGGFNAIRSGPRGELLEAAPRATGAG